MFLFVQTTFYFFYFLFQVWDETVKISGVDSDFTHKDLFEAIDTGNFPEWELGLQLFDQKVK